MVKGEWTSSIANIRFGISLRGILSSSNVLSRMANFTFYINTAVVTKYRIHAAIRTSACAVALAVIITPVGHIFRLEDSLAVKATTILTVLYLLLVTEC